MTGGGGRGLDEKESKEERWVKGVKVSKITTKAASYYSELSNSYVTLGKFSTNPGQTGNIE